MSKWICPAAIVIIIVLLAAAINFSLIELPGGDDGDDGKEDNNGDNGDNGDNGGNSGTTYYRMYNEGAEYEFQRTVVISTSGQMSYTLNLPSAIDITDSSVEVQDVMEISSTPTPEGGSPPADGTTNHMMVYKDTVNDGSTTITIASKVRSKTVILDRELISEQSGTVDDIDQTWKDQYNHDQWRIDFDRDGVLDPEDDIDNDGEWDSRIEPSNPQIVSLAADLTKDKNTVYEQLLAFYEHLISEDQLNYETVSSGLPKACTQTLKDKRGDCDDYSILFLSLCRAAGIPARLHFGLLYIEDDNTWTPHGWAEVYIPLKDGSMVLGTVDVVSKQFLIRDANHVTDWIDTGGDVTVDGKTMNNLDHHSYLFSFTGSGSLDSDKYSPVSYSSYGSIKVILTDAEVAGDVR